MKKIILVFAVLMLLLTTTLSYAEEENKESDNAESAATEYGQKSKIALGFTLDILPIVLSAASGDFGMTGQVWVGIEHIRIRLVGGRLSMPDWIMGNDDFTGLQTTVGAVLLDYTFGEKFDGWWVGTGFELWNNSISLKSDPAQKAQFQNLLWTVGGGYIWRIVDNFYIEPWAAMHVVINKRDVFIGNNKYAPLPVSGEVSLKVGYFFDI